MIYDLDENFLGFSLVFVLLLFTTTSVIGDGAFNQPYILIETKSIV
jgi:hypothetical protein